MDAASALNALKSGDVPAFIAAVEWDESEWIDVPADLRGDDGRPFVGRFGSVTVGLTDHGNGKYEMSLHSHANGEDEAKSCYATQSGRIRALLSMAEAMTGGPAVGVVSMSDIPYTGGMYV